MLRKQEDARPLLSTPSPGLRHVACSTLLDSLLAAVNLQSLGVTATRDAGPFVDPAALGTPSYAQHNLEWEQLCCDFGVVPASLLCAQPLFVAELLLHAGFRGQVLVGNIHANSV